MYRERSEPEIKMVEDEDDTWTARREEVESDESRRTKREDDSGDGSGSGETDGTIFLRQCVDFYTSYGDSPTRTIILSTDSWQNILDKVLTRQPQFL